MAKISVNGLDIAYEIIGDGQKNAIITPGGRESKDTPGVRETAQELAKNGYRVVIWDRPNCGESHISFEGESESILNADVLAGLLKALDMAPALVVGGSAGSRVSLIAALRHPEVVSGLAMLWISGSWTGMSVLASFYCGGPAEAARKDGMRAAAEHFALAPCVQRNPDNLERILAYDVEQFWDIMQKWAKAFFMITDSPLPCITRADLAKLNMPVLIFRSGVSDPSHPRATSEELAALIPGAQIVDPPWGDREWIERIKDPTALFKRWPLLVPQLVEFGRQVA
ncbi:alpha/beta hydrolase [Sphingobium sp. DEHP117]|uniref:alpha/beta fold hydrolase n=1 Tax=Sphingobium sp. DEHP117 TaxID=2993436 RepID=UPI0027D6F613|nr:alpha/beta fold hydrolase [Sphingobium sp. DEHP117]MDQ4420365.1 alpha/beta hydrolase [Sphingobium sp. DEHP117]